MQLPRHLIWLDLFGLNTNKTHKASPLKTSLTFLWLLSGHMNRVSL